jgi:hypothetical protein
MILEITKQRYKNRTDAEFKRFHWWKVIMYQSKWRVRSDASFIMDTFIFSSEATIEEEVTHPTSQYRVKTAARKRKGKEDSSSQSGYSSVMGGIMSTLKKLDTSFTRAQIWKQYNKLCEPNTVDMDTEELASHQEVLRLIKNDLNLATQNTIEVQDEDDEYNIYVFVF